MSCRCDEVFQEFTWNDLSSLGLKALPSNPGVYALRYIKRGLVAGWKLEYGWYKSNSPKELEKKLVYEYQELHGKLPALQRR